MEVMEYLVSNKVYDGISLSLNVNSKQEHPSPPINPSRAPSILITTPQN